MAKLQLYQTTLKMEKGVTLYFRWMAEDAMHATEQLQDDPALWDIDQGRVVELTVSVIP